MTVSSWYVRRGGRYFSVTNLAVPHSKADIEQACIERFKDEFPTFRVTEKNAKEIFDTVFASKFSGREMSIPVWNGMTICDPGNDERFVWDRGTVTVNNWIKPAYRDQSEAKPEFGVAGEFFDTLFTREEEKSKFLDWLSWCLQNEGDKPTWAPFLYSEQKGSGKSTLCQLVAKLFGEENSVTRNSVDKLTGRFNVPVLTSKFVISEELNLRAGSPQGNTLKTYITETETLSERKGEEVQRIKQFCCFLFTSNHLPLWVEWNERRYYLIDVDHDGHATGPKTEAFVELVGRLHTFMKDPLQLACLYRALMERTHSDGFSAKSLNVVKDATLLMKRVQGASEATIRGLLREHLQGKEIHALPDAEAARLIRDEFKANFGQTKHLMSELGWTKGQAKWSGRAHSRSVWVEKGYGIERGRLKGPDSYDEALADHFDNSDDLHPGGGAVHVREPIDENIY